MLEARHAGHDHSTTGGMMMSMAMDTMAATATSSASATASAHSGHGSMDMGSSMAPMHMFFTTNFDNYPVLFEHLKATTKAEAFGIFVLLFVVAFLVRGLEFVRNYLEQSVWHNPVYNTCHNVDEKVAPVSSCCGKGDESDVSADMEVAAPQTSKLPMASRFFRDFIRLILCILPDMFGYALMLVAMTYTLTYFFAVVVGSGSGRFFFERMSDRLNLRPSTGLSRHC